MDNTSIHINMKEELKPIKQFPNYSISNLGRVWSNKRNVWLKPRMGGPYNRVVLTGQKAMSIHRLVATEFIPNPENKPQVNHKDMNKRNNVVTNLEWATAKEDKRHLHDNKVYFHKYSFDVVEKAISLRQTGIAYEKIGKALGISKRTALQMCKQEWPVYQLSRKEG